MARKITVTVGKNGTKAKRQKRKQRKKKAKENLPVVTTTKEVKKRGPRGPRKDEYAVLMTEATNLLNGQKAKRMPVVPSLLQQFKSQIEAEVEELVETSGKRIELLKKLNALQQQGLKADMLRMRRVLNEARLRGDFYPDASE